MVQRRDKRRSEDADCMARKARQKMDLIALKNNLNNECPNAQLRTSSYEYYVHTKVMCSTKLFTVTI